MMQDRAADRSPTDLLNLTYPSNEQNEMHRGVQCTRLLYLNCMIIIIKEINQSKKLCTIAFPCNIALV